MTARLSLRAASLLAASLLAAACAEREPASRADAAPPCTDPAARAVVERFGERMRRVSVLAPDTVARRELASAYAGLVTDSLLDAWRARPADAPGRATSSPWPARIELRSIARDAAGGCRVEGEALYATSADTAGAAGGAALREPVSLRLAWRDGWRIADWEAGAASSAAPESTADSAAAVVRAYYAAIAARDYPRAFALWANGGEASGQTPEEFAAGFRETARVEAEVGTPGRIEGAAGSRYVEIPVVVRAVTTAGETQRFTGTYVLRRSVVDGATPAQRSWRIDRATLRRQP